MTIKDLEEKIQNKNIRLAGLREHSKASEKYVDVFFKYPEANFIWHGAVPYHYRRAGLFLESAGEVAELINKAYKALQAKHRLEWVKKEKDYWNKDLAGRTTTKPFFDRLLNLRWNCVDCQLPKNRNWARRTQDIKEMGYVLATHTRMPCGNCRRNTTHIILLPLERAAATGYETWSKKLRDRIVSVLGGVNVFEAKSTPAGSLIPDHKFPEIRWDEKTRQENPESMPDEEIRKKFQLLDNQRNQQKREACRNCFQTGKRGQVYGVKFFYEGDENWPKNVPKIGRNAERGCVGCPWYDLEEWRIKLAERLEDDATGS